MLHLDVETFLDDAVYVLDGIFELFVLVGKQARHKREDIRLAVSFAQVSAFFHYSSALRLTSNPR